MKREKIQKIKSKSDTDMTVTTVLAKYITKNLRRKPCLAIPGIFWPTILVKINLFATQVVSYLTSLAIPYLVNLFFKKFEIFFFLRTLFNLRQCSSWIDSFCLFFLL